MNLPGVYKTHLDRWTNLQTAWIISDPHFGDEELRAGIPNRPKDEDLVARINAKVGRKDLLIILGDVGDPNRASQLRGYKILVMGNHDRGRANYESVFSEIYEGPLMLGEKLLISHEPLPVTWAMNVHGHDHTGKLNTPFNFNVCADVIGYEPINFNQWLRQGHLSHIEGTHRNTIDKATARCRKKGVAWKTAKH